MIANPARVRAGIWARAVMDGGFRILARINRRHFVSLFHVERWYTPRPNAPQKRVTCIRPRILGGQMGADLAYRRRGCIAAHVALAKLVSCRARVFYLQRDRVPAPHDAPNSKSTSGNPAATRRKRAAFPCRRGAIQKILTGATHPVRGTRGITLAQLSPATQRRVMDFAASTLERVIILTPALPGQYIWRMKNAIKLLRNPPKKKPRGMRG